MKQLLSDILPCRLLPFRNHIAELVAEDWSSLRDTLATLFLGENDVDHVPREVFSRCRRLIWLNLDVNNILTLERESLPKNIQTLSLNHNLLSGFPSEAVSNIQDLTWLFLRGNLLDRLPDTGFILPKKLDKLDLGENFIRFIPNNLFNNTVTARDLHLDFNLLTEIQDEAFKGLNPGRLYLSANNIMNITEQAFLGGPEHSLVMLDLEKNKLESVPKALSHLKRLRYLYLPDNQIADIKDDVFRSFCESMEALSLSGNQLKAIPRAALENCSTIAHLNLGHNQITEIHEDDFDTWGDSLDTLILRNNRIYSIPPHAFRYTPELRELSLSFNRIVDVSAESFIDILNTLEVLEISLGFYRDDFPEEVLKPLTALQWIALDNNNFRTISETALYSFGELRYFNMDSNRLTYIPKTLFHQNVHKNLRDIRLALNFLERIEVHTFHNLVGLRTLVLTGNKIKTVHFEAFKALPKLSTILLANNEIETIEPRAFSDLPNLMELDLQHNKMKELSLNAFSNVTSPTTPLALNISYNDIQELSTGSGPPILLKSLDVSHNALKEVPINFLGAFTFSIQRLDLGYNLIKKLDSSAFGPLGTLQMLILEHNGIKQIRPRAFSSLESQLLDLSHNHLENLPPECFTDVGFLRVLDLSYNHLRSLPNFCVPGAQNFPNLIELNLANNRLTILSRQRVHQPHEFISLDLSGNPVRANFKGTVSLKHRIVQKLNLAQNWIQFFTHHRSRISNFPLNLISLWFYNLLKISIIRSVKRFKTPELLSDSFPAACFLRTTRELVAEAGRVCGTPWATLFAGENDVDPLPREVFSRFRRLIWVNLDVLKTSSPLNENPPPKKNIQTLSLNPNLCRASLLGMSNIQDLTWLFLRAQKHLFPSIFRTKYPKLSTGQDRPPAQSLGVSLMLLRMPIKFLGAFTFSFALDLGSISFKKSTARLWLETIGLSHNEFVPAHAGFAEVGATLHSSTSQKPLRALGHTMFYISPNLYQTQPANNPHDTTQNVSHLRVSYLDPFLPISRPESKFPLNFREIKCQGSKSISLDLRQLRSLDFSLITEEVSLVCEHSLPGKFLDLSSNPKR
ncbi:LOW QUALITY PROTEIN: chaoptin-like [Penaeus monodon]|uniref:LOW QUALITY PROTEIN: chaoptin-like n=1 Tax=Penaeus monodon TaxID=6687 RepID=UPI0018A7DCDC|nr:LOW QUALITY PROTEIN: chaoptin-like [Penaeus monodon]